MATTIVLVAMLPAPVLTGRHERLKRPHRDSVGPLLRAENHKSIGNTIDNSSRDWADIDRPGHDVVDADFEVVDDDKKKS